MSDKDIQNWHKDLPKRKASLSWNLEDYKATGDEPPECVFFGKIEGEIMEREDIEEWVSETYSCLAVLKEEYPQRYQEQYEDFILNLEYLRSLDKITQEELDEAKKEENFRFGKENS